MRRSSYPFRFGTFAFALGVAFAGSARAGEDEAVALDARVSARA